jgi:hypothetical protein
MSKKETRARLAALNFTEKIKILEKLRNRSLAFAASGMRRKIAGNPGKTEDEKQRLQKEKR